MRGCVLPFGKTQSLRTTEASPTRKQGFAFVVNKFFESAARRSQTFSSWLCSQTSPTRKRGLDFQAKNFEGFDPGSERTLAAWIRHASRTKLVCVAIHGLD